MIETAQIVKAARHPSFPHQTPQCRIVETLLRSPSEGVSLVRELARRDPQKALSFLTKAVDNVLKHPERYSLSAIALACECVASHVDQPLKPRVLELAKRLVNSQGSSPASEPPLELRLLPILDEFKRLNFDFWPWGSAPLKIPHEIIMEVKLVRGEDVDPREITQTLTPEKFAQLHNPNQPTIAIILSPELNVPFSGGVLTAIAARKLEIEGTPMPNILFIPDVDATAMPLARFPDGRHTLVARRGLMLDREGCVYSGAFPSVIPIDMVTNTGCWAFIWGLAGDTLVMNSEVAQNMDGDKGLTRAFLKEYDLPTVPFLHLTRDTIGDTNELASGLSKFTNENSLTDLVVKPTHLCQGRGVIMLSDPTQEQLIQAVQETLAAHQACVVEKWIKSCPLLDSTGKRLDWNIRALAGANGFIDMEARVGSWGGPINLARGAEIREVIDIHRELIASGVDHLPTWDALHRDIALLSTRAARLLGSHYVGLDLILDETGKLIIVELNCQHVGGMTSLAEIRREPEEKLRAPKVFADYLAKLVSHHNRFEGEPTVVLEPSRLPLSPYQQAELFRYFLAMPSFSQARFPTFPDTLADFVANITPDIEWHQISHLRLHLAYAYLKNGDYSTPISLLEKWMVDDPLDRNYYAGMLAYTYRNSGRANEALNIDRELVELEPSSADKLLQLILSAVACQEMEEARSAFERLNALPGAESQIRSAQLKLLQHEQKARDKALRAVFEKHDENSDWTGCQAAFAEELGSNPSDPVAKFWYAFALTFSPERHNEARELLKAVRQAKHDGALRINLELALLGELERPHTLAAGSR